MWGVWDVNNKEHNALFGPLLDDTHWRAVSNRRVPLSSRSDCMGDGIVNISISIWMDQSTLQRSSLHDRLCLHTISPLVESFHFLRNNVPNPSRFNITSSLNPTSVHCITTSRRYRATLLECSNVN